MKNETPTPFPSLFNSVVDLPVPQASKDEIIKVIN